MRSAAVLVCFGLIVSVLWVLMRPINDEAIIFTPYWILCFLLAFLVCRFVASANPVGVTIAFLVASVGIAELCKPAYPDSMYGLYTSAPLVMWIPLLGAAILGSRQRRSVDHD